MKLKNINKKEKPVIDWLKYENECIENGYKVICGVDEAGRGPLAGPVCAAAVILENGDIIEGVNDSKKLSEKKREELFDVIINRCKSYGIAYASEQEIDEINILKASLLAMKRAVEKLDIKPDVALIDGNRLPDLNIPSKAIIKGDANSISIACASILAKVSRDRLMRKIDKKYPEYKFEKHKGYGTKLHVELIKEHGISPIHRKSFLRKILNSNE